MERTSNIMPLSIVVADKGMIAKQIMNLYENNLMLLVSYQLDMKMFQYEEQMEDTGSR